jgi:hypothetical protein
MTRPTLNRIELSDVRIEAGNVIITMSPGQWDALLAEGYRRGYTLLELDDNENPAVAYRLCRCDICRGNN